MICTLANFAEQKEHTNQLASALFCIWAFMYFLYLYIFVFATTRLYWLANSPQLNVHHRGDNYIFNDEDVDEEQVRVSGCSSIFAGSTPAAC